MDKLKPCPFCGGKAVVKVVSTDGIALMPKVVWHRIGCRDCGARIEKYDVIEAIEAWNRRANDDK